MSKGVSPEPSEQRTKLNARAIIVGGLVVLGVMTGLLLEDLYRKNPKGGVAATSDSRSESSRPFTSSSPTAAQSGAAPMPLPKEIPPWEATPENSPPAGPGDIPAWVVRPP